MGGCSGEELLLLGVALSLQMARGRTPEELGIMAALFTVIGDNLALLATTQITDCKSAAVTTSESTSGKSQQNSSTKSG